MGPTARKLRVHGHSVQIAFALVAAPVLIAHAQVSPSGASGLGPANNWAAGPGERTPWLTYGIDAGVGESDNVTLAPSNKVSQTIATTDVDFVVKEQSRLLDANAIGDFSYLDYLQNAFGSQLIGLFDGQAKVAILPGRLNWVVQDRFGQSAIDPYAAVTPTNVENVNYFSTGPELFMRLGGVNFADLSARYSRTQYQTSPFNSNRGLGSLTLGRDISAGASVSLDVEFERVMFDNTGTVTTSTTTGATTGGSTTSSPVVNTDFNRTSGFGRYELHGARTDFDADLGATSIKQGDLSTSGLITKVKLGRQLSPEAKLTLTAGRELTDAGSSFNPLQNATPGPSGVISATPAALTTSNYTSEYASLEWRYFRNRTTIGLSARWEKDTYSGQPQLDVDRPGADFNIERRLTRAFSAQVLGRVLKNDFPNAAIATKTSSSKFDDWLLGGVLTWRHGRGLEINLRYNHSSHVVSAGGSGYGENRVFLTVGYRPRSAPEF